MTIDQIIPDAFIKCINKLYLSQQIDFSWNRKLKVCIMKKVSVINLSRLLEEGKVKSTFGY